MISLPTVLTVSRIAILPLMVFLALFSEPEWVRVMAASLFAIAAATDALDGYLARKWGQTTDFGAFLDPVADKLLVASVLVVLVHKYASLAIVLPALIIIGREITVSALREWMADMNQGNKLPLSLLAKWKTLLQMLAIFLLLLAKPNSFSGINGLWLLSGLFILYLAAAQTLFSMFQYLSLAWPALKTGLLPKAGGAKNSPAQPSQTSEEEPPKEDDGSGPKS